MKIKYYSAPFLVFSILSCISLSYSGESKKEIGWDKNKIKVMVELANTIENRVSIWNGCNYDKFNVYKQEDSTKEFKLHGVMKIDKANCLVSFFEDKLNSKYTNRYRVKPVVNNVELDTLRIEYARRYVDELDTQKMEVIRKYK